jgi:hypothetical protein
MVPTNQPGQTLSSASGATALGGLLLSGFISPYGTTPNVLVTNGCSATAPLTAQQIAYYSSSTISNYVPITGQANVGGEVKDVLSENLYGSDTVNCSAGRVMKLTLNANETLQVNCSLAALPTATQRFELLICQNASGNSQLTFSNTNIRCSSGVQPGYTPTANNGDRYFFEYDGTNLREIGFTSNVSCS